VVFAAVVLLLFGAVEATGGVLGAVFAAAVRKAFDVALRGADVRIDPAALPSVVAGTIVAFVLIGVLHIAAAAGILSHRNWGRVLGGLLCAIGIFVGGFLLSRAFDVRVVRAATVLGALGVLVPYSLSFLALVFAGDHFRPRHLHW